MDILLAKRLLEVTPGDDARSIKSKYRRLMSIYHPDVLPVDDSDSQNKAQLLNEAYHLLKDLPPEELFPAFDSFKDEASVPEKNSLWNMEPNEELYSPRHIYMSHDIYGEVYESTIAHGKYMWDPSEEDFSMFMKSLNHLSSQLMDAVLEKRRITQRSIPEDRLMEYHTDLFRMLAEHYMDPLYCLQGLLSPIRYDKEDREIYYFRAHLGADRLSPYNEALAALTEGDLLYPESLRDNRIYVMNQNRESLGHISLEKDAYYLCIIPLLRNKDAQIRISVRNIAKRPSYSRFSQTPITLDLYLRVNSQVDSPNPAAYRTSIEKLLRNLTDLPVV